MTSRTEGSSLGRWRGGNLRWEAVGEGGDQNKEVQRNERDFIFNITKGEESELS